MVRNRIICLVVCVAIVLSASPALAARGCNQTTPREPADFIQTDQVPPGSTKYSGILTVYYRETEVSSYKDVHFFLRLSGNLYHGGGNPFPSSPWGVVGVNGGHELLSFDYVAEDILYSGEEGIAQQQAAFMHFLRNVVNPYIFKLNSLSGTEVCYPYNPDLPLIPECPPVFLHSVDNVIEDSGIGSGLWFVMMDMVIAIDE